MPVCKKCLKKWTWRETVRKLMTLNPAITCPYCGEKQYQSQNSKNKIAFLTITLIFFIFLGASFLSEYLSLARVIIFTIAPLITSICLMPFLIELSNEEKYIDL